MKSPDTSRRRWIRRLLWIGLPLVTGWAFADHYLRGAGAMAFHAAVAEAGVRLRKSPDHPLHALAASSRKAAPGSPEQLAFFSSILTCQDTAPLRRLYTELTANRDSIRENLSTIRLLQRRMVELDPDATLAFALRDESPAGQGWPEAICQGWAIGQSDDRLTEVMRNFSGDIRRMKDRFAGQHLGWMADMAARFGEQLGPERLLRLCIDSGIDTFSEPYAGLFEASARSSPDAALAQYSRLTDPALRQAALSGLIRGLSLSDPARALELLADSSATSGLADQPLLVENLAKHRPDLLRDLVASNPDANAGALYALAGSLAQSGDPDAVAWADAHLEGSARRKFLACLFESQAFLDPAAALVTIQSLPPDAQRRAVRDLSRAASDRNGTDAGNLPPDDFWAALPGSPEPPVPVIHPPPVEEPLEYLKYRLQSGDYVSASLAANAWPASRDWPDQLPPLNADVARSLAEGYAQRDPAHAWEFATRQAVLDDTFRAGILRTWAATDPAAAAQVADHADPSVAGLAEGAIAGQWAATDPAGAAAWAQSVPGRADRVASILLPSLADSDPAAARAFAATLPDSAAALAEIERRLARSQGQP